MKRIAVWMLAVFVSALAFAGEPAAKLDLTAAEIVEKNVAARGGLEAWRKIQTMVWVGHVERANAPGPRLPFVLQQKRSNKTRFEMTSANQMFTRVYDGSKGWKLRASGSAKPELQPYTAEELKYARDEQAIDGPLIDYQAKGVALALEGVDEVDGNKAYRLSLRLPSGASRHVWVDAQSFLDVKYEHESRTPLGQPGTVSVFYRNYQSIDGLQIPLTIETRAGTAKVPDKLVIDKISLNPPLDDRMFGKPRVPGARRNAVTVDTTSQANRLTGRPTQ
jgi:outer membrane lipoprotein-sorting protein